MVRISWISKVAKINGRDGCVDTFGNALVKNGEDWCMRKLVNSLADGAGLPGAGKFGVVKIIDGAKVTIRGEVVDGIPKIGTAFIAP